MHNLRFVLAFAVTAMAFGAATIAPSEGAAPVFPPVTGQNLNGKRFDLPGDFQGPASFVFVAYVRGQQSQVDSWKSVVADARKRYPQVGQYEVPTLSRGNSLFRGFIDGGMRNGIQDPAVRAVTITLYIDKRPFNASLGITSEDEIAVLLVKPDGTVLWRSGGAYADGKSAGLEAALSALHP
jgi:hypothetical protein